MVGGIVVDGGSFDWDRSRPAKFAELTSPTTVFTTWCSPKRAPSGLLLRARREGLRDFGACMSPHTAWLILQGIETLPLRMAQHMRNTEKVVEFLAAQPFVSRVGPPCWSLTPAMPWRKSCCHAARAPVFSFDLKGNREQGKSSSKPSRSSATWPTWATAAAW